MKDVAKEVCTTFVNNFKRLNAYQLITTEDYSSDTVRRIWIWGPSGVGKTSKVWKDYGNSLFNKAQNKWFDGYAGEETIFLDNFDKKRVCPATT